MQAGTGYLLTARTTTGITRPGGSHEALEVPFAGTVVAIGRVPSVSLVAEDNVARVAGGTIPVGVDATGTATRSVSVARVSLPVAGRIMARRGRRLPERPQAGDEQPEASDEAVEHPHLERVHTEC